jgi:hypothetical protein
MAVVVETWLTDSVSLFEGEELRADLFNQFKLFGIKYHFHYLTWFVASEHLESCIVALYW